MLHDGWKQGLNGSGNSTHTHPLVAANELRTKVQVNSENIWLLEIICNNIEAHMGEWNTSKWDKTVLPTPQGEMQDFVHLCDYLASRKDLEFNFAVRE
jgi:hypothetical protein